MSKDKHTEDNKNKEIISENEAQEQKDEAQEQVEATQDEVEVTEVANEAEKLEAELEELKENHLRLRAEYDNFRKRTLKEKSDLIKYGGEKTIIGFLGIMDDIELAIKNMSTTNSVEGMLEGVELIQNKFITTLKAQGVNAMDVVGQDFDPDQHDAVAMVPTEESDQKGKIIDCLQTGYTLNDKVIRHPKVVVGN